MLLSAAALRASAAATARPARRPGPLAARAAAAARRRAAGARPLGARRHVADAGGPRPVPGPGVRRGGRRDARAGGPRYTSLVPTQLVGSSTTPRAADALRGVRRRAARRRRGDPGPAGPRPGGRRRGGHHLRHDRDVRRLRLRRRPARRGARPARRRRPGPAGRRGRSPTATWAGRDLDAQAFVQVDGVRHLRTSDLGAWPTAPLTVLGRADDVARHRRRQGAAAAGRGGRSPACPGSAEVVRRRRARRRVGPGRSSRSSSPAPAPDRRRSPRPAPRVTDRLGAHARPAPPRGHGSLPRARAGQDRPSGRAALLAASAQPIERNRHVTTASDWVQGARPRTLPAAVAPVARRHRRRRAAGRRRDLGRARCSRSVVALALQVGRQLRQRLLRRHPRHGRRPRRPAAPDRSGAAQPGAVQGRGVRRVRRRGASPASRWSRSAAQWWLLAVGAAAVAARLVLHRRLAAVRLPRARRGRRVRVLRARRGARHRRTRRPDELAGRRGSARSASACSRARCSWPTTCATSRPTPSSASARSPCASASTGTRRAVRGARRRSRAARRHRLRVRDAVDAARPAAARARRSSLAVTVLLGARGRALVPVLAGTGLLELAFGVLLGLGLAL